MKYWNECSLASKQYLLAYYDDNLIKSQSNFFGNNG